jgi:hypothetical protein
MCGDYIALSKITIKNQYSLPKIDNLFDQLQHARFLTKLDLKSGLSPYSSEGGRCVEDCNQNQSTIVQMHCGYHSTIVQMYCGTVQFMQHNHHIYDGNRWHSSSIHYLFCNDVFE